MSLQALNQVDPEIKKIFYSIRDRVLEIKKKYGSIQNYGYPIIESPLEASVIYVLNKKYRIGYFDLARELGVSHMLIYRLINKIEKQKKVTIFDPQEKKMKIVVIENPLEVVWRYIEEKKKGGAKKHLIDITQAKCIKEFLEFPMKRASRSTETELLNERQIRLTLRAVEKIAFYIKEKHPDLPSNPDLWDEKTIIKILNEMEPEVRKRRVYYTLLRRIPKFREWFRGLIKATINFMEPVERVLFVKDYYKIKKLWKEGKISDPEWLILALHIQLGTREGWRSYKTNGSLDEASTSLIGLRWENMMIRNNDYGEYEIVQYKVYEAKTLKWWICEPWLDPDIEKLLLRIWKKAKKPTRGSVIKTILKVYGIYIESTWQFANWYTNVLKKISRLANLGFELKPHDLRRSHLSILAELGVPLELAVTESGRFGVGWEDLKTAVKYYLRLSRRRLQQVRDMIKRELKTVENEVF